VFADGGVWSGGSGLADVDAGRPVTPHTLFAIASITKTFTAALVMRLVEDGDLSLDDRLTRWLPDFPHARGVTVRQLLGSTSGLAALAPVRHRPDPSARSRPSLHGRRGVSSCDRHRTPRASRAKPPDLEILRTSVAPGGYSIRRVGRAFTARWEDSGVEVSDVSRAMAAAISTAIELDLAVDDATVLHNSNKLALRLLPCNVLVRVARVGHEVAEFEVDLAQRLADTGSPVAVLEPRVEPRVYERDGFAMTFWKYYRPVTPQAVSPVDYASGLKRLHEGMRRLDVATPHFIDRVADAQRLVASRDHTPTLAEDDRKLLSTTLRSLRRAIGDSGTAEQLLHGEPHPGNVLSTHKGLLFVDLETCCHGPVEFDLAHVPEEVSERYPGVDQELVRECRQLVLAMVAAWRWDPGDQFPNGRRAGRAILRLLRNGPPWPTLGDLRRLS
jgi:hypothetical protein